MGWPGGCRLDAIMDAEIGDTTKDTVHRGIGILELRPVNNIRRRRL